MSARTGDWRMLFFTSLKADWKRSRQCETFQVPVFDQKNCMYTPHVLAMDVGQEYKVETSDQTAHNIHPEPNPLTGNIPWNRRNRQELRPSLRVGRPRKSDTRQVQYPSLDARLVRCGKRVHTRPPTRMAPTLFDECASWKLHSNCVAGKLWYSDAKVTVAAGAAATADFTFKAK